MIGAYSNLYMFYLQNGDSVKAYTHLTRAHKLLNDHPDNDAAPKVYSNLGQMYMLREMYDSAIYYYNLRLDYAQQRGDSLSVIKALTGIADAELNNKNPQKAQPYIIKLEQLLKTTELSVFEKRKVIEVQYRMALAQNNTVSALYYLQQYDTASRAIRKMETDNSLQKFEMERANSKREKAVIESNLKINKQKYIITLLVGTLGLLFIAVPLTWAWHRQKRKAEQERMAFSEKENILKAQLEERNRISRELHDDLGASLTSLALAGDLAQKKTATEVSEELSIMTLTAKESIMKLNEIVWMLNNRNDSFYGLIAYIRKFAVNFLCHTAICFSADIKLPEEDTEMPAHVRRSVYLIAKEAFHNIVKHSSATEAAMQVYVEDDKAYLLIRDNGKGILNPVNKAGNGLRNMQYNVRFIKKAACTVENHNGTVIKIIFPVVQTN